MDQSGLFLSLDWLCGWVRQLGSGRLSHLQLVVSRQVGLGDTDYDKGYARAIE
jgi:hypothetical protein